MGISLRVENAEWYNSTRNLDLVASLMKILKGANLSSIANCTAAGLPIII